MLQDNLSSPTLTQHTLSDQLFVGKEFHDINQMPQVFGPTLQILSKLFASYPDMKDWSNKQPTTLCNRRGNTLHYRIGYILSSKEASALLGSDTAVKAFGQEDVFLHSIPSGTYVQHVHVGSLDQLPQIWENVIQKAKEQGLVLDMNPWTYWQTCHAPKQGTDSNQWTIEIWYRTLQF